MCWFDRMTDRTYNLSMLPPFASCNLLLVRGVRRALEEMIERAFSESENLVGKPIVM
jgi:hypothetical protein